MKLKYTFVVREIAGNPVAVAVGKDNVKFHGMVKMNHHGAFIFRLLQEGDCTEQSLVDYVTEHYAIPKEMAQPLVKAFVDQLRQGDLLTE